MGQFYLNNAVVLECKKKKMFTDVFLLSSRGEIYGNENVLLCKVGRLLVVYDKGQIKCYLLNCTHMPVSPYVAQRLKDECLAGTKKCSDAFKVPDKLRLSEEPDVCFGVGLNGTCDITFSIDPVELKNAGEAFYNLLIKENEEEHFDIFRDMVEIRHSISRVKVFIHNGKPPVQGNYDVVINISTAQAVLDAVPYFWDVYYDATSEGIEYNPVLLKLSNVRPLFTK